MLIFLAILNIIFLIALITVSFFAIRWAKIIFILEDDLEEAILIHQRTIEVLQHLLTMPMFFDSPEVKAVVVDAMESVKICQIATHKLINNFTQRSKQKYVRIMEDEATKE